MKSETIEQFYIQRIKGNQQTLRLTKQNIHYLGTCRILIVVLAACLVYLLREQGAGIVLLILLSAIISFLWLVVKNNRQYKKKKFIETSLSCDKNELKALNYDFSAYDGADEKSNGAHPFSLDLDVFGHQSLFQSINRTCTISGKTTLCEWFENPMQQQDAILSRQQSIRELAQNPEFVHHFQVTGLVNPGQSSDSRDIHDFVTKPFLFSNKDVWKVLFYLIPGVWLTLITLSVLGLVPFAVITWVYICTFVISESQYKQVNRLHHWIGKKVDVLATYSELIQSVEREKVEAKRLTELQSNFLTPEGKQASVIILNLSRLAGELDQRSNLLVHILLNPFMLWDIRKSLQIEQWKNDNRSQLATWIQALGEYDAFCSLATFTYNHPKAHFPTFTETYFEMRGKGLKHPLIPADACIPNDIHIGSHPYFMVVTGANMAGKSTYLRTVGINFLLACMGAPVCADSLSLYPACLITSLRTSDSLSDNESYFFAELKRLKMIIDELNSGKRLFIILDEILKGTNSVDKQKGSLALLKQFVHLQSCGIIATHDLMLGNLEKEFPRHIGNYRFEADITDNELTFSYQLSDGIAQNMNACFLMKKMGITV